MHVKWLWSVKNSIHLVEGGEELVVKLLELLLLLLGLGGDDGVEVVAEGSGLEPEIVLHVRPFLLVDQFFQVHDVLRRLLHSRRRLRWRQRLQVEPLLQRKIQISRYVRVLSSRCLNQVHHFKTLS